MNRQVLVPLDGSGMAEAVLPLAATLARSMSGSLTLASVVADGIIARPLDGVFPTTPGTWEGYAREAELAREYLNNIAERLRAEKLVVETVVLEGAPAHAIVDYAAGHPHVKLIAMATHARTGIGRLVLGSIAEQILHDSPVPVMLVHPASGGSLSLPASLNPESVRKILVPLDGSAFAEQSLEQAKLLAANLGASLILFTVLQTEYDAVIVDGGTTQDRPLGPEESEANWAVEYLGDVARRLRLDQLVVETRIAYGGPAEEILKAADRLGADMIVMSTHGRSGLPRLWVGSVAMQVVHDSNRPVVLVRSKDRVGMHETKIIQNNLKLLMF